MLILSCQLLHVWCRCVKQAQIDPYPTLTLASSYLLPSFPTYILFFGMKHALFPTFTIWDDFSHVEMMCFNLYQQQILIFQIYVQLITIVYCTYGSQLSDYANVSIIVSLYMSHAGVRQNYAWGISHYEIILHTMKCLLILFMYGYFYFP